MASRMQRVAVERSVGHYLQNLTMYYRQLIEGCFAERIGTGGLTAAGFEKARVAAETEFQKIRDASDAKMSALLSLPRKHDDLTEIRDASQHLSDSCTDLLIIGTGGSSLGARTLCALAAKASPKLHFLENVDPAKLDPLLAQLRPNQTKALFISKSGGTVETLAVSMIVMNWLIEGCGVTALERQTMAITEQTDNPLARLCCRYGIPLLAHEPEIDGRYSVFSAVGMLPAMIAGLDVAGIRNGAISVLTSTAPVDGAALAAAFAEERQHSSSVLMPYRDQLADLALWYRQLWAESLGKDGKGTTPIQASGTVDQHSQLQLYLDGRNDRLVSMITCPLAGSGLTIPNFLAKEAGMPIIGGRPIGDLLDAFSSATADALAEASRPVRVFEIERLDEATIGALMMHFILETLITAGLWQVNPFGQPAVEAGKKRAKTHLSEKPGYAA
tara:strand:+ start:17137 stop:18471 length:1335 start_codon:yes stop_codon:yes gene_type:complete